MKTLLPLVAISALSGPASAQVAERWVSAELLNARYTNGHGERDVLSAEYGHRFGATTWVVQAFGGSRDYQDGASFADAGLAGTFYRNWDTRFSTRSHVAFSKDEPVFANRRIDQAFSYKALNNLLLTAGLQHTGYSGGVESNAWYSSTAYYVDRVMFSYRYTRHRLSGIDDSYGQTLTVRLKDRQGAGSTQLWLGQGTSVQEYDWSPEVQRGDVKTIALRRVQPLSQNSALNLGLAKEWYDTPLSNHNGLTSKLGVTYRW